MSDHHHVHPTASTYDVIVVGAGAAGLSGALALGRARRTVLVLDAGHPRNAPALHIHNYLGREGTSPADFLAIGRAEVAQYGVEVRAAQALGASKRGDGSFVVTTSDGDVTARRLLVTTGLVDELPAIPGVAEGWGDSVIHCPYCHGWEVQDQPIGVLASNPLSVHQAQLFRQWSDDVVLFLNDQPALGEEQAEGLAARRIPVVEGAVVGWGPDGVRLASGELVARQALVVGAPVRARAELLVSLGLETSEFEMGGHSFGTCVVADPMGLTAVPGVFVAGNVTDPRATVIAAAAAGLMVGAAINLDLITSEIALAVEQRRFFAEEAWEERYRETPDGRWSGNPNAVLVSEVSDLVPGRALDVGCGEGGDALWLAARGWAVTGIDISTVALARATQHAESQGLQIRWAHVDLVQNPPEPGRFDLVTAHFMQLPATERVALYAALAKAVAPGGTLLLVGHDPSGMPPGGPHLHDMFFTAEQLAAELDGGEWDIRTVEARPRPWTDPDGNASIIKDAVLKAVKRPWAPAQAPASAEPVR